MLILAYKGELMKELEWLGSSKKDLARFPKEVVQEMGYALFLAQKGECYPRAKLFKGYGSGVYEVATEYDKNAYRAVYIVNLADKVYVLHCFQKKSKRGIKTPREELAIIEKRLSLLKSRYK
jgi:phage-related protein